MREGEQRDAAPSRCWDTGSGGVPTKTTPHHLHSYPLPLLDPQFSLSVGGDCLEGWSEDTVSRLVGCWGREEGWDLDHPSIHEKGMEEEEQVRVGWGVLALPSPVHRGSLVKNRKQFTPKINRYLLSF